jgi:hypothetical protein
MSLNKIILGKDLKALFYKELDLINSQAVRPISEEILFYSAGVLENYTSSERYFDIDGSRVRDKTLGQKLLESNHLGGVAKARAYQEIGETSLVLCGVFRDSLNKKLVDLSFYHDIGQNAFSGLDSFRPFEFNMHGFYQKVSENFCYITELLFSVSKDLLDSKDDSVLNLKYKVS